MRTAIIVAALVGLAGLFAIAGGREAQTQPEPTPYHFETCGRADADEPVWHEPCEVLP